MLMCGLLLGKTTASGTKMLSIKPGTSHDDTSFRCQKKTSEPVPLMNSAQPRGSYSGNLSQRQLCHHQILIMSRCKRPSKLVI